MKEDGYMINRFKGDYFFLCNFFEAPISYKGLTYQNNEAAFQAQKTLDENLRLKFTVLSPSDAKSLGRSIPLRPDWEDIKEQAMYEICLAKFTQHPDLMHRLLMTGNRPLEEGNTWGDQEWGTVNGIGQNKLGKILMRIRAESSGD